MLVWDVGGLTDHSKQHKDVTCRNQWCLSIVAYIRVFSQSLPSFLTSSEKDLTKREDSKQQNWEMWVIEIGTLQQFSLQRSMCTSSVSSSLDSIGPFRLLRSSERCHKRHGTSTRRRSSKAPMGPLCLGQWETSTASTLQWENGGFITGFWDPSWLGWLKGEVLWNLLYFLVQNHILKLFVFCGQFLDYGSTGWIWELPDSSLIR